MLPIFQNIRDHEPESVDALKAIIESVRPPKNRPADAILKIEQLTTFLKTDESLALSFKNYLARLASGKNFKRLFTDSGILSSEGFFRETYKKVSHSILPPVYHENDFTFAINEVFYKHWDYQWVEKVPNQIWTELFLAIQLPQTDHVEAETPIVQQILNSILVLSQRIATMGLEPELLDKLPELDRFESPFIVQSKEIALYIEQFNKASFDRSSDNPDYKHILVMLSQCEEYILTIRKNKNKFGASLQLTYLLQKLHQSIYRTRLLLSVVDVSDDQAPFDKEIELFKALVRSENKKNSLSEHFGQNLNLLAFQMTENAGKTGEHYITSNRKEWWEMLRSAMGGGLIVGFLTIFKTLLYYLKWAPFGQALAYSANYSFGFIAIHLSHSTLATKQPAMTASKIAGSLDIKGSREEALNGLVDMIARVSRSQFIAFVGNVLAAFPVGYGLAWLYFWVMGEHIADLDKAGHMVDELHPWRSLAFFHAAIAGVYLFIAGLISGYYDNLNIYNKIALRLQKHKLLIKIFGQRIMNKLSAYIDGNLGSLAGNFFFGIFLGCTGTIGFILGLPLDIRHITFSAGNFGIALVSLDHQMSLATVLVSIIGIVGIGFFNFIVSFSLAIFVAIKSRNVNFRETTTLVAKVSERFFLHPKQFFFPSSDSEVLFQKDSTIHQTKEGSK